MRKRHRGAGVSQIQPISRGAARGAHMLGCGLTHLTCGGPDDMKKTFAMLSFITIASFGCGGGGKKTPASAKSMPSSDSMDCEKFADQGIKLTLETEEAKADPTIAEKAGKGRGQLVTMCTDGKTKGELDQAKYDCAMAAPAIKDFMTCLGVN